MPEEREFWGEGLCPCAVELHPSTEEWMRGARAGSIVYLDPDKQTVKVKVPGYKTLRTLRMDQVRPGGVRRRWLREKLAENPAFDLSPQGPRPPKRKKSEPEATEPPPLPPDTFHPEAIAAMRRIGGRWAVYENHDLGHPDMGRLAALKIGPGCTFQHPPKVSPDRDDVGPGWRYLFVGWANLSTGKVERCPWPEPSKEEPCPSSM